MIKRFYWVTCILLIFSTSIISWKAEAIINTKNITGKTISANANAGHFAGKTSAKELFAQYVEDIYNTAQLNEAGLGLAVFQKAVTGYFNLKAIGQVPQYSSVLTIVDLAKSSCLKRMWIVDLVNKELVLNTWAAHGNGSGGDIPQYFSNSNDSHASSLGFYITNSIYSGKHGRSLKLDGMDAGFNDNARSRSVVVHGAPYVSQGTINQLGRLGRSEGCPAVSPKVIGKVIETIKGRTVMFINGNDSSYSSKYLDEDIAANYVYPENGSNSQLSANL